MEGGDTRRNARAQAQNKDGTIRRWATGLPKEETLRSTETKFQCDNCQRTSYNDKPPTGWNQLKIWSEDSEEPDPKDICDSCSQAIYSTMGKRRSIERGSYRERPMQEFLKSPEAADADSYTLASRAPQPTTD